MTTTAPTKVLILTAGFGDGHNTAAKNLALALREKGADVLVDDPCAVAAPRLNRNLQKFYRYVTTHSPELWHQIYLSTERQDFSRRNVPFMRKPEAHVHELLREWKPDAVVSTYPLYPYFCARAQSPPPSFTVITDSIHINAAWRKAPCDHFLVTDETTRQSLLSAGLKELHVTTTGFPVHTDFAQLASLPPSEATLPFRVLYFPTSKKPEVRRHMRAILRASPQVQLTVVLGRNTRTLHRRAKEVQLESPDRVKLLGWTTQVPQLLSQHHLVIGKAGGATVHEAIAACCPMLISHLVPGQEEGNLKLLQQIGAGQLTQTENEITVAIQGLLKADGSEWRQQKHNLAKHTKPNAASKAASFILRKIEQSPSRNTEN